MSPPDERTPDLARVAPLPPSPALDERVRREGVRIVQATARGRQRRAWTGWAAPILARAALAAVSAAYLTWAVSSAARLYR